MGSLARSGVGAMWDDIRFSGRSGAKLAARRYRGPKGRRPLVCLAGMVGNSADFHNLAEALSSGSPEGRSVYCIDCRGRGASQAVKLDGPPDILTDAEDVLDLMTLAGLADAAVIGTGHGGQLAMIVALLRPKSTGVLILNDAAPEFEVDGVVRMMTEIASMPVPATWQEAAGLLKSLYERRYPRLTAEQWGGLARARYMDVAGRPARAFDKALAEALSLSRGGIHERSFWPQFAALSHVPTLLMRGALSDMISQKTVEEMRAVHPLLEVERVAAQGHPVLLNDEASFAIASRFLVRHDAGAADTGEALKAVA